MLPITCNSKEESDICPISSVLSSVMGKWRMIIVLALEDGELRFAEVKRAVGDVTQRVLTENLRGLERDGYLTRTVMAGPPLAVSYKLTDRGQVLVQHFKQAVGRHGGALEQVDDEAGDPERLHHHVHVHEERGQGADGDFTFEDQVSAVAENDDRRASRERRHVGRHQGIDA